MTECTRLRILTPRDAIAAEPIDEGESRWTDWRDKTRQDWPHRWHRELRCQRYASSFLEGREELALPPFCEAFVPVVDVMAGLVTIDPPKGWNEP